MSLLIKSSPVTRRGLAQVAFAAENGLHARLKQSLARYLPIFVAQQQTCRPISSYTIRKRPSLAVQASTLSTGPSTKPSHQNAPVVSSVFDETASDHLPSLPVPSLSDTLERLRGTIYAVAMNSREFAQTLELIERFEDTAGPKLDLLLRSKARQTKNWMSHDWWQREAYLKSRAPLVVNSNPAMIYPQLPFEVTNQRQLINTVSQLISGVVDFKLALQSGYNPEATNETNEFRLDQDLCYAQYRNIFGTTRQPGEQIDKLVHAESSEHFHFVISMQGQFYEVTLSPGTINDEQARCDTLANLLNKLFDQQRTTKTNNAANSEQMPGAGLLTTCARDKWASTRRLLDESSLQAIDRAQFLVCLDSVGPACNQNDANSHLGSQTVRFTEQLLHSPPGSQQYNEALSRQILHADPANVSNRWFDKSLQLVIISDQSFQQLLGAGVNYEHTVAEGTVITKLIEYSYDKLVFSQNKHSALGTSQSTTSDALSSIKPLHLMPQNKLLEEELRQAQRDYVAHINQFDLAWFDYRSYGANAIKSWRFSPDSWFQVALQLAHFTLHRRLGPCYESASTRRFAFGRTETIRSLTKDVSQFCHEPCFESLERAIHSHKEYAIAANNANAIDRTLLGYRLLFNELRSGTWRWGVPMFDRDFKDNLAYKRPSNEDQEAKLSDLFTEQELETLGAFFNNQLIERSKKFALSTSQVSSLHSNICMSYGPFLMDGYGCCYNITGQQIVAAITANSENRSFSCEVDRLSDSLHNSLDRMRGFVEDQKCK